MTQNPLGTATVVYAASVLGVLLYAYFEPREQHDTRRAAARLLRLPVMSYASRAGWALGAAGDTMSRINLDPLMTFPDGSHLVASTLCSKEGDFSCALYNAIVAGDEGAAFRIVSSHLESTTCLGAQEHAYNHAVQLFPHAVESMKKPPYLIWQGPSS